MPVDSIARICLSMLQSSKCRAPSTSYLTLRPHSRKYSQRAKKEESSLHSQPLADSHKNLEPHPPSPRDVSSADAIAHLRKTFPPLEFPEEVALQTITHVSWNRGLDGHNGRLSFVGRRVLHTYLLLFLHECMLPPAGYTPSKRSPVPPSARLRPSALSAGGPIDTLSESYDDISDKLLNTYVLGEHVGREWELERVMRWTPAVAELDTAKAESPHVILRSSGLYKVRGATVEGVMGGIFHQFGGAIAHRVFHTRVLPHISHVGLPYPLRPRVEEACEKLGGRHGLLTKPGASKAPASQRRHEPERLDAIRDLPRDQPLQRSENNGLRKSQDAEYTRVDVAQRSRELRRTGYAS